MGKGDNQANLIGYLVRDIPRGVMDKIRAAAAIHKNPTKAYIRKLFESHIRELEKKGMTLSVSSAKRRKRSRE